jgi:hypothetical protein
MDRPHTVPFDTSSDAARVQLDVLRRPSASRRMNLAAELGVAGELELILDRAARWQTSDSADPPSE